MTNPIEQAAALLRPAQHVTVLTGAGVSAESGVPTFREAQTGLWAQYNAEELATPQAFQRNPQMVWSWYEFRRELVGRASPNPGHMALAQLEQQLPKVTLITQNVDDLHEQAGSQNVVHLHGNIAGNQCFNHCQGNPTPIDITQLDYDEGPPTCPHCGAYVRPAVVWFNEMLPPQALAAARAASQQCDVMLVVGTSGLVMPAAALPDVARRSGAHIIEVNPDDTPITHLAAVKLSGPSGAMLPQLVEALSQNA